MDAEQLSIALSEAAMLTGESAFLVDGQPAMKEVLHWCARALSQSDAPSL